MRKIYILFLLLPFCTALYAQTTEINELSHEGQRVLHFGTTNKNVFLGTNVGNSAATGNYNVGIGENSLLQLTTGYGNIAASYNSLNKVTTGINNVGLGYSALANNTTGGYNIGLSYAALNANTTGGHNIGMGYVALYSNTIGNYNIGMNYGALNSNKTGSNNIAMGYLALNNSIAKNSNIAIGSESMRYYRGDSVVYTSYNVAIGQSTLRGNSSDYSLNKGYQNVAIGVNAMLLNEAGNNNVAINNGALYNNKNGSNNVAIGYATLNTSQATNYNVAIGFEAMRYANDTILATSPYNVAIGMRALRGNTVDPTLNSGGGNVAVGGYSQTNNTNGGANTSVGYNSLVNNTSGSYNTAIGHSAMSTNVIGQRNTVVGMQAGQYSNSNYNTYIGMYAGMGVTANQNTGGYNVALGFDALRNVQGIGGQNVAIGQAAGNSISVGIQNTIIGRNTGVGIKGGNGNTILGYGVTGLDSSLNNNLILATANGIKLRALENGNVGIGINNPRTKFEISNTLSNPDALSTSLSKGNLLLTDGGNIGLVMGVMPAQNGGYPSYIQARNNTASNIAYNLLLNPLGGNVGIGTVNPGAVLDVKSTGSRYGFILRVSSHAPWTTLTYNETWSSVAPLFSTIAYNTGKYAMGTHTNAGDLAFYTNGYGNERLTIKQNGQVVIGVPTVSSIPLEYKLAVAGNIIAEKVKVKNSNIWPDYVFEKNHNLLDLQNLEEYIEHYKHLPEIPSAAEIEKDGQDLGEMNRLLLKKVEELTLYLIEQEKKIAKQSEDILELKSLIKK